jgi:hypothetical protein
MHIGSPKSSSTSKAGKLPCDIHIFIVTFNTIKQNIVTFKYESGYFWFPDTESHYKEIDSGQFYFENYSWWIAVLNIFVTLKKIHLRCKHVITCTIYY